MKNKKNLYAMTEMNQIHSNASNILEHWNREVGAIKAVLEEDSNYMKEFSTACMLENTSRYLDRIAAMSSMGPMTEATQPADVGYFRKYAINLLAAAVPNLIAQDIVSLQPMLSRVGEVRYLKVLYGSNKGKVKAGDVMFSTFEGGTDETEYSSSTIDSETAVTSNNTLFEGSASWTPVIPGSFELVTDAKTYKDDGNGKVKDGTAEVGTIDYTSGKYKITLAAAVTGTPAYLHYDYNNMDVPVNAPEVNLKIEVAPILAKSRKLKTLYAFDSAFDMAHDYGMQINEELVAYTASQIRHEIDGEILGDLYRGASAKSVTWSSKVAEGISMRDHNESFFNSVIEAGNNIFNATKLANASFLVVGVNAANIVESLPRFRSAGALRPVGPHLTGYLGTMPVYKNPFYPEDAYLVGWKGAGLFDAGYIYAPYMPIMSTMLITDANFQGSRGFATSYGKKMINTNMYAKGIVTKN